MDDLGHVSYWISMWRLVAFLHSSIARVEAMKAENQRRVARGESPAYGENRFLQEAEMMSDIGGQLAGL